MAPSKEPRDFWGRPLAIGQTVAYEEPGHRNLMRGQVLRFTPKMVVVSCSKKWDGEFRADPAALIIKPEDA